MKTFIHKIFILIILFIHSASFAQEVSSARQNELDAMAIEASKRKSESFSQYSTEATLIALEFLPLFAEWDRLDQENKAERLVNILKENIDVPAIDRKYQNGDPISAYRLALIKHYSIFEPNKTPTNHEELKALYEIGVKGNIEGAYFHLANILELQSEREADLTDALRLYLHYYRGDRGQALQVINKLKLDYSPTAFEQAKQGKAVGFYRLGQYYRRNSYQLDKAIPMYKTCADMEDPDCLYEYARLILGSSVKGVQKTDGEALFFKAANLYKSQYGANPDPVLATRIAECLGWSGKSEDPEIRKEILEYFEIGRQGGVPRAISMLEFIHKRGKYGVEKNLSIASQFNKELIFTPESLPADIEDYERYFGGAELVDPTNIKPASVISLRPEKVKAKISTFQKPVVLFTYNLSREDAFRQLVRLSEIHRICATFGDQIELVTYMTYYSNSSGSILPDELRYEDMLTIVGISGEHYYNRSPEAEMTKLNRNAHLTSDRLFVYPKNKKKQPVYLDANTTEAKLVSVIQSMIKRK